MKPLHYVVAGFAAVVIAKVLRGLLNGWLNLGL